jgi:hypothetical protein
MTREATTSKFVVQTFAIALGIAISIGVVYLTAKYTVPTDQAEANHSAAGSRGSAELSNPDVRLWRVHLLLR